jgi:hypothetical protein
MATKEKRDLFIKLAISLLTLIFIVFVAFYPYKSEDNRAFFDRVRLKTLKGFSGFLIRIITEGGGNIPNIVVILVYSAMKDQRHRAFMHVLFY